jgi:alkanesulfonate monooxygenase SsuD/methylene tetrahydromethanopterin reductase-like flavin-dependent oxidoreductase (luciferase family)
MARPKVILQLYPTLPAKDEEERKRLRPIGRNKELYNQTIHDWIDILKAAEEMGVWGAATIEHHLHSEGYEVGPNPGVLNAWWAGQFKKLHVGALGYVMATRDPIRVAEETAILDHITKGRYFVGLARGYQSRWTNVLGQFSDSVATVSDGSADDIRNRDIFEERTEMLLRCWTEASVALDGKYYKAPYPYETGVQNYPAWKIASEAGGPGEIDPVTNAVRRLSVCPAPYQDPHPPVFVATSKTDDSVKFCARNGFVPTYFSSFEKIVKHAQIYREEAKKAGRTVALGQKQNICRWSHIAETEEKFNQMLRDWDVDIYKNFYAPFFPAMMPTDPKFDWVKNIMESGIYTGGTPEQARQQWKTIYDAVPAEYITLIYHFSQQPKDEVIKDLGLFMTEVWPHLEAAASDEPVSVAAE